MRKHYYISFSVAPEEGPRFSRFVEEMGCADGWRDIDQYRVRPGFEHVFEGGDPRLGSVLRFLETSGVKWLERCEHIWTVQELREAPLLEFRLEMAPREWKSLHYREQFDFSTGCPRCGIGALQVGPLRVKVSALPKKALMCETLDGEYLVAEPLREALEAAGTRGAEVIQVVSPRDEPVGWWQVVPRQEMPPLRSETRGFIRDPGVKGCPECRRDTWCHTGDEPSEFVYGRSQLRDRPLPDVAETYERVGVSGFDVNGYLPRGRLLVSPRIFDVLQRLKVRGARFNPVRIIDD